MTDLVGQELKNYRITARIGEGGMGVVYQAYQESVARDVAIKVISERYAQTENFAHRFEREARICASLNHPHIIKVFDYDKHPSKPLAFIAMELHTGGSLARLIKQRPLSLELAGKILGQIASALDYAHQKGVIHRDLKPENVLLDETGNAILSDFGLAKLRDDPSSGTGSDVVVGTWSYISPEQWKGLELDLRADVYGLGIMLYEMLTGTVPFHGETSESIIFQHLYEQPRLASAIRPDLPPEVDQVINRALAKDREARYASAGALLADFEAATRREESVLIVERPLVIQRTPICAANLDQVNVLHILQTGINKIDRVSFDSRNRYLACGGMRLVQMGWGLQREAAVQLWDTVGGSLKLALECMDLSEVTSLDFSPDDQWLAAGGQIDTSRIFEDARGKKWEEYFTLGSVNIWDIRSGKRQHELLNEVKNSRSCVAFRADSRLLVADQEDGAYFFDTGTGQRSDRVSNRSITMLASLGDRSFIVKDEKLRAIVGLGDHGERELFRLRAGEGNVCDIATSPNGRLVACGTRTPANALLLLEAMTGRLIWQVRFNDGVWSAAFSADNALLAAGVGDGPIKIFDVSSGKELHELTGHSATVNSVAFNREGSVLASGSSDGTVRLWALVTDDDQSTQLTRAILKPEPAVGPEPSDTSSSVET